MAANEARMEVKDWLYTLGIVLALIGSVINAVPSIRKVKRENEKTDAERQEVEDRITANVLARAEEQLKKYHDENEQLRAANAEAMKMLRAMRMLTVKLVRKMEQAGIDPELTDEEREALYDTDKLARYAKRQGK